MDSYDVIVIGGGQSGLAVGYFLRRADLSYLILDDRAQSGGAWRQAWDSLRLFSPARWSSLPGTLMAGSEGEYPSRHDTIAYLEGYEHKYELSVRRPVEVTAVHPTETGFRLDTTAGAFACRALVCATGTFRAPFVPEVPGLDSFGGKKLHSADYRRPDDFAHQRVLVVGEGNSGAQILAEVSTVADTVWSTAKPPQFLPDHIDGRYLFDAATAMYEAQQKGQDYQPPSLGNIVMVPPVRDARQRDVLHSFGTIARFTDDGVIFEDGAYTPLDVVIFCTGFRPALGFLAPLGLLDDRGRVATKDTRARQMPGLWLVGYGGWTGFASATLVGVGRTARATVGEIKKYLAVESPSPSKS